MKVAEEHGVKKDTINNLLDQKTRYHGKFIKPGRFLDIVEGRFQIDEIIQVNRKNDEHTISNKSLGTIKVLFDQGDAFEYSSIFTQVAQTYLNLLS